MKNLKAWAQGDIVLLEEKLPEGAEEVKDHDGVLFRGEATGHRHRVACGQVRYFRNGSECYAYGLTDFEIVHEDHPTLRIPAGTTIRYYQEREVDWINEVNRNVAD